jgi:hypothetical protein
MHTPTPPHYHPRSTTYPLPSYNPHPHLHSTPHQTPKHTPVEASIATEVVGVCVGEDRGGLTDVSPLHCQHPVVVTHPLIHHPAPHQENHNISIQFTSVLAFFSTYNNSVQFNSLKFNPIQFNVSLLPFLYM